MRINKSKKSTSLIKVIVSIVILALIAGLLYYVIYGRKMEKSLTDTPKTQSDQNITNGPAAEKPSTDSKATTPEQPTVAPDTVPSKPAGTFVSNHRPNISGQPSPNSLNSTCVTTPGAVCVISFEKNGVTKSLPEKVAGSDGVVSWDWSLSDIGLTIGIWQITAQAKNGTKVTKALDNIPLEVDQ